MPKINWQVAAWLLATYWTCVLSLPAREVQSHGLLFEKWLRETFFAGYEPKKYTQKWDIPADANIHHGHIPVNPKATKLGTPIGLGDALRQFEIEQPFLLIVGFWQQVTSQEKRWVNVQAVRVEPATWRKLWGNLTRKDLDRLITIIKDPSLSIAQARELVQLAKKEACFASSVIELNPKIDGNQRRLQCSLGFRVFFDHLAPSASREAQAEPKVFGVPVPSQFNSEPRVIKPEKQLKQPPRLPAPQDRLAVPLAD
jgi:hypothetical protein